jgi:hypothetical protein
MWEGSMRKATLIAALAVIGILGLTACGTETAKTDPVKSPGTSGAQAAKAGIGDTLELKDSMAQLQVTVTAAKRLPALSAYGTQVHPALYGVQITVKNLGSKVYDDSVTNGVALIDAKDQSHDPEFMVSDANGNELPGQIDQVKIRPGDRRSGWVFFALGKKLKARSFQLTPSSGFGEQVGEWSLR